MEKPAVQTKHYYVWRDARDYFEKKYKVNLEDVKGRYAGNRYTSEPDLNIPMCNFWGWVSGSQEVSNGSYIHFSRDDIEDDLSQPEWKRDILTKLLEEFGEGGDQECSFMVDW